ncbi:MAG: MBOAT family protein [candidate division Zixibacteria bacterium]|nr:MBOAT family protein [candidate division Zixibacteria bacterium]
MLFNSFAFAIFFPIVLLLYWILPFRAQNLMLLVASYVFYGYWDWRFLALIALSTIVDYITGLKIQNENDILSDGFEKRKKIWLTVSMVTNLGILGFFKYYNFFADSFADVASSIGVAIDPMYLNIILPVGISFYTFQTMSYTIDIYRGKMKPTNRFFDFALYVAFFPQLVAGPIERAKDLLPRLLNKRKFSKSQFYEGLHLILLGLFKKVFVADNLAPFIDKVFRASDPSGFEIWVAGWGFAIQVYCDFSGYSDIARGCAKCMGIELMINFNHPYIATNPVERWQRWHISLSSWLRDYLYIPLGGSRGGERKTLRNLWITMLLGGLWHGAAWNFVLWGAWEGVMLITHRMCKPFWDAHTFMQKIFPPLVRRLFKIFLMFNLITVGLIIFRTRSIPHLWQLWGNVFTFKGTADPLILMPLVWYALPLAVYEFIQYQISRDNWSEIEKVSGWFRTVVYAVFVYLIAFHGASAQSFIYFQF